VTTADDFAELETIDHSPRPLGAPELVGLFDDQPVEGVVIKE
jgi:hypothetical protein